MNLFWKKMFGGMTSTAKLEKNEAELAREYDRYCEVGKSAEWAEFKELQAKVKTPEFKQNKKMLHKLQRNQYLCNLQNHRHL